MTIPAGNYPTAIAELAAWRRANGTTAEEARRRLVQFVVLACIASADAVVARLALKGGNALRFVHGNARATLDLDFTAEADFPDSEPRIAVVLDLALRRADRQFQVKARCLSVRRNPKNPERTFPTYRVNVCYQLAGDRHYQNFEERKTLPGIELEISLNDVLCETFHASLSPNTSPIRVCTLEDILAEKLRALLQQVPRNRSRPQDVHDIASRLRACGDRVDLQKLSEYLLRKAAGRDIVARKSAYDEAVRSRALVGYDTEMRIHTPDFIPFEDAWSDVLSLVARLAIPD